MRLSRGPSCGPPVLVDKPAEDRAAPYPRHRQVCDGCYNDAARIRWPQVPGPVRTMPVIGRDVLLQHCPQVPRPGDQHPIGALARTVRTHLPAEAFARGLRGGIFTASIPAAASTAPDAPVN